MRYIPSMWWVISRRTLESWFTGKTEPKVTQLKIIAEATGTNIEWLITGVDSGLGIKITAEDIDKARECLSIIRKTTNDTSVIMCANLIELILTSGKEGEE